MLSPIRTAMLAAVAGLAASSVEAATPTLTGVDINASVAGSLTVTNDSSGKPVYVVVGGGGDIWNASDGFYYAYFKQTGDFDYVVKVAGLIGNSGDGGWAKAELMARQDDGSGVPQGGDPFLANMSTRPSSDTANSAPAGVNNRGPQWRAQRDGQCSWTTPSPTYPPNADHNWMRLERVGSVIYMYTSDDGKNWNMFNPYSPQGWDTAGSWPAGADNAAVSVFSNAWPNTILLGLAVTSHNDGDVATAVFSDFGPYTPTPVAITTQPVASLSVAQNNALSLSVAATGDPVHYQWLKDGKPIAQAVTPTYKVSLAQLTDAGSYTVRVFGGGKELVSSPCVVSVTVDTVAPTVKSITPETSFTGLRVEFSEPVTDSALTASNYKLDQGLNVTAAARVNPSTIALTTSKMAEGQTYTLTLNGVKDTALPANTIATDTKQTFKSLVFGTGMVTYERWDNDTRAITDFVTAVRDGSNRPSDVSTAVAQFGGPWGVGDNYNSRVSGYFVPASSGSYIFFLASDDQSNLYLSTDDQPANVKLIAQESGWSNQYQWATIGGGSVVEDKRSDSFSASEWPTGGTITLTGGKRYFMEILHHEGGGGDGSDATFIKVGDADPAQSTAGMYLRGSVIGSYLNPNGANVTITAQPQSVTIFQNTTTTFNVAATGTSVYGTNVTYQWQRASKGSSTFSDINGATTTSYTTPIMALADDGAQFRAVCTVPTLSVNSEVAVVTINNDVTAPTVVSAGAIKGGTLVGVAFSELVDQATAETAANYQVNGATPSSAVLHFGKYVELGVATAVNANFTLTVKNVKDLAGNAIANASVNGALSDLAAMDVGTVGTDPLQPGYSISLGNDAYLIAGGGHDIWDSADGFQFAYKEFTGAFDARVRVEAMNPNGPNTSQTWAKAELMVRETTAAGSRHNSVCATRPQGENAIEAQWRDVTDAGSGNLRVLTPVPYPNAWLRLVREDATKGDIKLYTSADGVNWKLQNTHTTPATAPDTATLPAKVLIGLAVTSHDNTGNDILAQGLYQSFSVKPYTAIIDPQLKITKANAQISISWAAGTLVASPTVKGTYAPVAGATSPFTVTPTDKAMFYQIQQ